MGAKYIGAEVKRREDPRLLRGRGTYVDDLKLPGLLHAAVVRSPHAHARLGAIRADAALRLPGVVAVFTFDDLKAWLKPLPVSGMPPPALQARVGFSLRTAAQLPLASGTVRYAGEPVAVLVAESRYVAEDALELVSVDYEPLPVVPDSRAALVPGAPLLYPEWGDNVGASFTHAIGDVEGAFRRADTVVRQTLRVHRYAGMPMECRGVAAALSLPAHRVRVIAPDVGGGFGTKATIYPEEVFVPVVAWHLGRPVKWVETRREHMVAAIHSREQIHDIALA